VLMNHVSERITRELESTTLVPMYLGRWISFYMDINDQLFAGTKGRRRSNQVLCKYKRRRRKFEDEAHSEEIPRECVHCKSVSPS
jgi:hypothetical protein